MIAPGPVLRVDSGDGVRVEEPAAPRDVVVEEILHHVPQLVSEPIPQRRGEPHLRAVDEPLGQVASEELTHHVLAPQPADPKRQRAR